MCSLTTRYYYGSHTFSIVPDNRSIGSGAQKIYFWADIKSQAILFFSVATVCQQIYIYIGSENYVRKNNPSDVISSKFKCEKQNTAV